MATGSRMEGADKPKEGGDKSKEPSGETPKEPGKGPELAQIAAAATAVIGVIASLAVTGVLGAAQRNHGIWLIAAFSCVLAGALIWLLAALLPSAKGGEQTKKSDERPKDREPGKVKAWLIKRWRSLKSFGIQNGLRALGGLFFAVGVGLAVTGLVITQQDAERPAVSAVFDAKTSVLTAKVTAEGLSAEQRMLVLVKGLTEVETAETQFSLQGDPRQLYFAALGPNSDGKIAHEVSVFIPKIFDLVSVKAWTGPVETACLFTEEVQQHELPQHLRHGCLVLRLPEETTATTTTPPTTTGP
jgi:hypothetical protein